MPNASLACINSPEGHDAFLLEFAEVNLLIVEFLKTHLPEIMGKEGVTISQEIEAITKSSLVGEAEVEDLTNW